MHQRAAPRRRVVLGLLCCIAIGTVSAAAGRAEALDDAFKERVTAAIDTAIQAFSRLGRDGAYLSEYAADEAPQPDHAQVHPNATPQVGHAYLLAHCLTGNPSYLALARRSADLLVEGQLDNGGWSGDIPLDPDRRARIATRLRPATADRPCLPVPGNMDDGISHGPIDFLFALADATGEPRYRDAARAGLQFLVNAQYPIGAWPQRWPIEAAMTAALGGYPRWYTINDSLVGWNLSTLLAHRDELPEGVADAVVENALKWLLFAQLPEPQPGWAQQYDYDMQPVAARWHEPAAVSPDATADALDVLFQAYLRTGDPTYLQPFPSALRWLRSVEGPTGLWFRYFELGAGRRIYVDEHDQRTIRYFVLDSSLPPGYPDRGLYTDGKLKEFGCAERMRDYARLQQLGRDKYLAALQTPPGAESLRGAAEEAMAALDEDGCWVDDEGRIPTTDFCRNLRRLCAALAHPQGIGRDFTRLDWPR